MGMSALALSTSTVAILACLVLFVVVRARLGGIEGRYLSHRFLRTCAASLIMALPVWITCRSMTDHFGTSRTANLLNLAVSIPIGLGAFFAAAVVLKIDEIRVASEVFAAPILRKLFISRTRTHRD
jgi:putative peptidoglycan lipid II flippase